ncbi:MAG: Clp protease N-terminal domain-containing protein, partial [Planctomycetaceae bacterium]
MAFDPRKATVRVSTAIQSAQELAEQQQHRLLRPLHLLKSLLEESDGLMKPLLQKLGTPLDRLLPMVASELERLPQSTGSSDPVSASAELVRVLNEARRLSDEMGDEYTSTEHLILALATVEDQAKRLLSLNGIELADLQRVVREIRGGQTVKDQNPEDKYQALEKYSVNLTARAREGKIDPVIGRDEEIRRTIQVLSRRTKNNPV